MFCSINLQGFKSICRITFVWFVLATSLFFLAYITNRTTVIEKLGQMFLLCGLAAIFLLILPFQRYLKLGQLWTTHSVGWLCGCCFLGIVIIFAVGLLSPLELLPLQPISVSAEVLPLSSANSLMKRHTIIMRAYADGLNIAPNSPLPSGWEYRQPKTFWDTLTGFSAKAKTPAALEFKAIVRNNMTLIFPKSINGGRLALKLGNTTKTLDTFSNSSAWEEVYNDDIFIFIRPDSKFSFVWLILSTALCTGLICFGGLSISIGAIILTKLSQTDMRTVFSKNTNPIILFVLACLIPCLYWLCYYPGLMSCDSLNDWSEVLRQKFCDTQPVFYTLVLFCLTRLWLNPAVVSLFNIICFGLAVSFTITIVAKRWRLSSIAAYLYVLAWSALPVANFMLITVWKDTPYSICILWITVLVWMMIKTDGRILASKQFILLYVLSFIFTCLLRHNGIAVVAPLSVVLIILLKKKKRLILATLTALLVVGVFKTMALALFKVEPMSPALKYLTILHVLLTLKHDNVTPTAASTVNDVCQFWEHSPPYCFTRFNVLPTAMVLSVDKVYKLNALNIGYAVQDCLVSCPLSLMRAYLDISSIVWNPVQPSGSYTYAVHPGIDENNLGLHSHSKIPFLKQLIDRFVIGTSPASVSWLLWRPAIYLYIVCFFCLVLALKYGNLKICSLAIPLIMNSLVIAAFNSGQDVRYLLSNFFVMPFVLLLFISGVTFPSKQMSNQ